MERGAHRPLSPAVAKARLRGVAARGALVPLFAQHRRAGTLAALAAGVLAGVSPRFRTCVLRSACKLVQRAGH